MKRFWGVLIENIPIPYRKLENNWVSDKVSFICDGYGVWMESLQ